MFFLFFYSVILLRHFFSRPLKKFFTHVQSTRETPTLNSALGNILLGWDCGLIFTIQTFCSQWGKTVLKKKKFQSKYDLLKVPCRTHQNTKFLSFRWTVFALRFSLSRPPATRFSLSRLPATHFSLSRSHAHRFSLSHFRIFFPSSSSLSYSTPQPFPPTRSRTFLFSHFFLPFYIYHIVYILGWHLFSLPLMFCICSFLLNWQLPLLHCLKWTISFPLLCPSQIKLYLSYVRIIFHRITFLIKVLFFNRCSFLHLWYLTLATDALLACLIYLFLVGGVTVSNIFWLFHFQLVVYANFLTRFFFFFFCMKNNEENNLKTWKIMFGHAYFCFTCKLTDLACAHRQTEDQKK